MSAEKNPLAWCGDPCRPCPINISLRTSEATSVSVELARKLRDQLSAAIELAEIGPIEPPTVMATIEIAELLIRCLENTDCDFHPDVHAALKKISPSLASMALKTPSRALAAVAYAKKVNSP